MQNKSESLAQLNQIITVKENFLEGAFQLRELFNAHDFLLNNPAFLAGMHWLIKSIKEEQPLEQQGQFLDAMEQDLQSKKRKRNELMQLQKKFEPKKKTKKEFGLTKVLPDTQENT